MLRTSTTIGLLILLGCGTAGPSPSPEQAGPTPGVEPAEAEFSDETPRDLSTVKPVWDKLEKPPGVELTPLEFKFWKIDLVIDVPPGTKVQGAITSETLVGEGRFGLRILFGHEPSSPDFVRQAASRVPGATWYVNLPQAAAASYKIAEREVLASVAVDVGGRIVYVTPYRKDYDEVNQASPEELYLMLYSASTLRRKAPIPTDPKQLVEELDVTAAKADGQYKHASFTAITPAALHAMAPALTHLETLGLKGSPIDDESLRVVATLENLESVRLEGTSSTDAGLAMLAKLPKLRSLELNDLGGENRIHGASLAAFQSPPLEELEILLPLSDEGWKAIAKLTRLKILKAPSDQGLDDEKLAALTGLSELEELIVHHAGLTDACTDSLAKFANLRVLWLSGNEISDEGFARLRGLTNLEVLAIDRTNITVASLPVLRGFTKLTDLHADDEIKERWKEKE